MKSSNYIVPLFLEPSVRDVHSSVAGEKRDQDYYLLGLRVKRFYLIYFIQSCHVSHTHTTTLSYSLVTCTVNAFKVRNRKPLSRRKKRPFKI